MASKRIQGITIEIDGNATKLNTALKSVDKQLATTKSNLRDVDKLLKFNPGNADLLKQKQKLLGDEIEQTKERLERLKAAQTDALSTDEYNALQREIIETEGNLESLEKQYKDFGSVASQQMQAAGESVKKAGKKISGIGDTVTKGVTVPILGIGTAAIASAKDLDDGYDTIITKTGATGDALDDLTDQMDDVFADLPVDAETAGNAIGEVNTRFGLTGDTLEEVSKDFIRFAEINGTDVSDSVDKVDRIMKTYGVDASQTGTILGAMTKAGQDTGLSMDTLGNSLDTNGEYFKELGLSVYDSIGLLAQFESNGVDTSTALAGLKKAQQNATAEGKTLSSALTTTAERIKNAGTQTEALEIATELFGKKGALEMTNAIREGRFSLDDLSDSTENYADVVKNTYESTIDPWDEMKVAINNLKIAGNQLAQALFKTLKPMIDKVVEAVKKFTTWFNSLNDKQRKTIVKIGLLVAAAGPLLSIIGRIVTAGGSVITGIGKLIGGASSIIKAISGGGGLISTIASLATKLAPFLVAGAVIVGIIAAIVLIVKNFDKIKAGAAAVGKAIASAFKGMLSTITNIGKSIGESISSTWGRIKQNVSNTWESIRITTAQKWASIKSAVSNGIANIKTSVSTGFNGMKSTIGNAWHGITTTITTSMNGMKSKMSSALSGIKTSIKNAFSGAKTLITSPFNGALTAIKNVVAKIKSAFKFKISLPKIKLPHINVRWSKVGKYFSIPQLSIKWYKKAYDNPMMFSKPTVLQTANGMKGFGDGNGSEVVLGLDKLKELVGASGDMNTTINVYANEGMNVNQLADAIQIRLTALQKQKAAAYA